MSISPEVTRFFVVHMMKTGGTTLTWHARATYGIHSVFPYEPDGDGTYYLSYTSVSHFLSRLLERLEEVRVALGHVPLYVASHLPGSWATITVLRDPVDRVASMIRAQHRGPGPLQGLAAEEMYERDDFRRMATNHQVKMLSVQASDGFDVPLSAELVVDDARVAAAKSGLETIDYLALHEAYDDLLARLAAEQGWRVDLVEDQNVGTPLEVPAPLLERIRRDNEADAELVAHARHVLGL